MPNARSLSTSQARKMVECRVKPDILPVIIEVQTDSANCGADVRDFSQYPREEETIFHPHTLIEWKNMRVEGSGASMGIKRMNLGTAEISCRDWDGVSRAVCN